MKSMWLGLVLTMVTPGVVASAPPGGAETLEALAGLVGTWDAKTATGRVVQLSYRLVANESVLVETFTTASGKETLTVFHADGPRLLATHYCAQRNQPRLALTESSTADHLVFDFVDGTNLKEGASHLRRLELERLGPDKWRKTETYTSDGKDDVTVFDCSRRAD
jgi:hypothetical protein